LPKIEKAARFGAAFLFSDVVALTYKAVMQSAAKHLASSRLITNLIERARGFAALCMTAL
jgi:hypothetical protein